MISAYFLDPVLRAPTIASMLMCLTAALVGVIVFLKKEALLGEALSHAAYPGVVIGVMVIGILFGDEDFPILTSIAILSGAMVTALLGMLCIKILQKKARVAQDASLCFVLSAFFGIGILLASDLQFSFSYLYKQIQVYFYGQAATMSDIHIVIYGALAFFVVLAIILLQKELKAMTFDEQFAKTLGINVGAIDSIFLFLVVLSVVIGIRSVGVVLMSAMLIAPAAAARQYTNHLTTMFWIAGFFGLISAFFGTYFSVEATRFLAQSYPEARLALPSGPMIVLVATLICLLSLLFAKERGALRRWLRGLKFRRECLCENVLKTIWRFGPQGETTLKDLGVSAFYLRWTLRRLWEEGWLTKTLDGKYCLTSDGEARAAHIVRLHRLWEVYLANYLGLGAERVHRNAKEMEHIITPELERELTQLLNNPKQDPHQQPIPPLP